MDRDHVDVRDGARHLRDARPVDREVAPRGRRVARAEARVDGRQRVEPVAGGVERGLDLGPAVVPRREEER